MRTDVKGFEQRALTTGASFPFKARVMEYVVDLVTDPRTSVPRLAAVIGWNPMLMRSLSTTANSTSGMAGRIRDVNLALGLLGEERIKETVKWAVTSRATRHIANSYHYCEDLWGHSIMCAVVSRAVALELEYPDPNRAFVAGLVHDIGFLFLAEDLPSPEALEINRWRPVGDARSTLHEEAGFWMLDRWETLDEGIKDAVHHHHGPGGSEQDPMLAAIVHVADVLCHRHFGGPMGTVPDAPFAESVLTTLGLAPGCHRLSAEERLAVLQQQIVDRAPALDLKVGVLKDNLVNAYEELGERERLVLALHYFEGMSLERIAGMISVTRDEVLEVHGRAAAQIAAMLAEFGEWS